MRDPIMVTKAEAIAVLFPNAISLVDYVVADEGRGQFIAKWNPLLGKQPTQAELDAVTQVQVDAAKATARRNLAKTAFEAGGAEGTLLRASNLELLKTIRQLREAITSSRDFETLKVNIATLAKSDQVAKIEFTDAVRARIDAGDGD